MLYGNEPEVHDPVLLPEYDAPPFVDLSILVALFPGGILVVHDNVTLDCVPSQNLETLRFMKYEGGDDVHVGVVTNFALEPMEARAS